MTVRPGEAGAQGNRLWVTTISATLPAKVGWWWSPLSPIVSGGSSPIRVRCSGASVAFDRTPERLPGCGGGGFVVTGWIDAELAKTYTYTNTYNPDGSPASTQPVTMGNIPTEKHTYTYDTIGRPKGRWRLRLLRHRHRLLRLRTPAPDRHRIRIPNVSWTTSVGTTAAAASPAVEYATAGWVDWYNNRTPALEARQRPAPGVRASPLRCSQPRAATRIGTAENPGRFILLRSVHGAAGVVGGLLVVWLVVVALIARPKGGRLTEAMRLLPDLLRLLIRLGRDQTLPRGVRVRLGFLAAYLALPFDLVPDLIPVLGYADDVIVVVVVLRSVVRRVGVGPLCALAGHRRWLQRPVPGVRAPNSPRGPRRGRQATAVAGKL